MSVSPNKLVVVPCMTIFLSSIILSLIMSPMSWFSLIAIILYIVAVHQMLHAVWSMDTKSVEEYKVEFNNSAKSGILAIFLTIVHFIYLMT